MRMRVWAAIALLVTVAGVWTAWPSSASEDVLGAGVGRVEGGAAGPGLPFYGDATFTPSWDAKRAHRIGAFPPLTDQTGRPFGTADLDGRITVVSFFYATCHGICTSNMRNLSWLAQRFAHDGHVQIASHSVTGDAPQVLARYGKARGVDPRQWRLLTGDLRAVDALMRSAYFTWPAGDVRAGRTSLHTENLLLIDAQRRIRGVYRGTLRVDVEALARDIERLEAE